MLRKLDEENARSPFVDNKMQNVVQSYDLLQNEKYSRLDELKHVLDTIKQSEVAKRKDRGDRA